MIESIAKSYLGAERRHYKRINKNFMSKLRIWEETENKIVESGWNMVSLQNLSAGGVLMNLNRSIDVNSLVDLKINFPMADEPIECTGKVVRVEDPSDVPLYRVAVTFTKIKEEDKNTIQEAADVFYGPKGLC